MEVINRIRDVNPKAKHRGVDYSGVIMHRILIPDPDNPLERLDPNKTDIVKIARFDETLPELGYCLAYHFAIHQSGLVEQGMALDMLANGACGYSYKYIQVAMIGNFTQHPPTLAQLDSATELVGELCSMADNYKILPHATKDFRGATRREGHMCPGKYFDIINFRDRVRTYIRYKAELSIRNKGIIFKTSEVSI